MHAHALVWSRNNGSVGFCVSHFSYGLVSEGMREVIQLDGHDSPEVIALNGTVISFIEREYRFQQLLRIEHNVQLL